MPEETKSEPTTGTLGQAVSNPVPTSEVKAPTNPTTEQVTKPVVQEQAKAPVTKPYNFDEKAFEAKLTKLTKLRDDMAGKTNFNSHLWFNAFVKPLEVRYLNNERTELLFRTLIDTKDVVPPINDKLVEVKEPAK